MLPQLGGHNATVLNGARRVVDLLSQRKFAELEELFTPDMKAALPEAELRRTWDTLETQLGSFKEQLTSSAQRLHDFDLVLVACVFARATLNARVVFNAELQVAGLSFTAAELDFKPPPYARADLYRERGILVGSGPWALPATLTMPVAASSDARVPAVVLVHGSGPMDRDETIGANKPFRDLAWGLASRGIAVLRYEKRTRQHGSRFLQEPLASTFTLQEEVLEDAVLALQLLRRQPELDPRRLFLLGHSLGGMAAPAIAEQAGEELLRGLITLAGCTRPLEDLILEQTRYILSQHKRPLVAGEQQALRKVEETRARIKALLAPAPVGSGGGCVSGPIAPPAGDSASLLGGPPSYWLDMQRRMPLPIAARLPRAIHLLILQGDRDYQVTSQDLDGWKSALQQRPEEEVRIRQLPGLNHLFMAGDGPSTPQEYALPGHVAGQVIDEIVGWIEERR
jgi:fermentation-respiration switch protein FrsA (DUF1100 family)